MAKWTMTMTPDQWREFTRALDSAFPGTKAGDPAIWQRMMARVPFDEAKRMTYELATSREPGRLLARFGEKVRAWDERMAGRWKQGMPSEAGEGGATVFESVMAQHPCELGEGREAKLARQEAYLATLGWGKSRPAPKEAMDDLRGLLEQMEGGVRDA